MLHQALSEAGVELALLDYDSEAFAGGVVITSAHISKGLEFDVMIVPHADDTTYFTEMDRCVLYIAYTRAMHELDLTHDGRLSRFLEFADEPVSPPAVDDARTTERSRGHAADAPVG